MTKKKRTKYVATFVHPCDGFMITDDEGTEIYPHAGETVTFRRDMPWEMMSINPDMTNLEYCTTIINILLRQIKDWTWTDDDEILYPKPKDDPKGFALALVDISMEEREYLRAGCWQRANLGETTGSES